MAIACGAFHSVALKNNGSIVTWGSNLNEQLINSPMNRHYKAIACGFYHSVALKGWHNSYLGRKR